MKKYLSFIIAAALMLSVAACGKKDDNKDNKNSDAPESAVSLLETVWNTYGEDEKFAAAGGDSNEANAREDAPGVFGIDDTDALDSMLGFPAAAVDKIDGAASLMHMMNQNTFTCGAYHVRNSSDVESLAGELKDNILARHWMCGFPEKLVIVSVGDYLVSYFGDGELVDLFTSKLTGAFSDAKQISETPIE